MKCFFVNDFEYINNNLHKISSENFCVTTSIFIYHFLKQNKFINVHLIGYNLTPEDRYNLLIKYFPAETSMQSLPEFITLISFTIRSEKSKSIESW